MWKHIDKNNNGSPLTPLALTRRRSVQMSNKWARCARGNVVLTRGGVVLTRGSVVLTRGSVVLPRGKVILTRDNATYFIDVYVPRQYNGL